MTRSLKAFLLALTLFPLTSPAGTIEVAQWLPWDFVSNEIYKRPLNIALQESEWQMTFSELTPKLRGVKIDINGELKNLSFSSAGINADQVFNSHIQIEKIIIDQMIVREFNGNQIRIHLQATCSPLSISIPVLRTSVLTSFIQQAGRWQPELTDIGINIPADSWSLSSIECTGIGGVGEEIASTLTAALKNPASFEPAIKSMLVQEMRKVFQEGWTNLLLSTGQDLTVTGMERPTDDGLLVFAELNIKNDRVVKLQGINQSLLSDITPQLIFSNHGFEALLEDKFMDMAPQKFNLQSVKEFSGLMKSRLKQYFAWPDLRRFSSSTPFLISTYTDQSQLRLKAKANGKWQANLNANGVLETFIGGSKIDYIQFGIGVASEMSIQVDEGKLHMTSGASQLELAWSYGFLYQMIFRPNTRIAIDILKSGLNQFFSHKVVEEELPSLKFQHHEWKLQNWKQQNEIITMDWL